MKVIFSHLVLFFYLFFAHLTYANATLLGDVLVAGGKSLALRYDAGYKPCITLRDFNNPNAKSVGDFANSAFLSKLDLEEYLGLELRKALGKKINLLSDNHNSATGERAISEFSIYIEISERYNDSLPVHRITIRVRTIRSSGYAEYEAEKIIMSHSAKINEYVKEAIGELVQDFAKTYFTMVDVDLNAVFNEPFLFKTQSEFLDIPILTEEHVNDIKLIKSTSMKSIQDACENFYRKALPILLDNISLPPKESSVLLVNFDNTFGLFEGFDLKELFYNGKHYVTKKAFGHYFFMLRSNSEPNELSYIKSEMKKANINYIHNDKAEELIRNMPK